ncbi:MAG: hypothetical protein M1815_003224 [Lichina confinis]|nr:MAG: hypothetical protein M1815_003224 [Lichina confinis]
MTAPARLTVLISGNGSNLQALIDVCASTALANSRIVRVISNRKGARGLERARQAGIATHYHNLVGYGRRFPSSGPSGSSGLSGLSGDKDDASASRSRSSKYGDEARRAYDADLAALVLADDPHLVVCAGWMHVLSDAFLVPLHRARVPAINLHPALPGEFNGAAAIERAWRKARDENLGRTGVMVHYVIAEVDCGEAIVTEEVPLRRDESLEDLEDRMHVVEHRLIVDGTRLALERLPGKKSDGGSSGISDGRTV